ncbi:MAG TPA: aminotransferase class I/II-fold pyridoxal phosphate-dependent enzyme [Solirubrobacteraceae bacterium]|nr:aminotransferase class I/II-fold pyridoxal phosphate-dependent enzyme [Solirubrobacteraceae bacterium]
MRVSPTLAGLRTYPFVRLDEAKRRLQADGVDFIDFGVGEPREETPAFIREALVAALEPLSTYPSAAGLPDLRLAVAEWTARRFGAALDPDTQVLPTLGSKEAIFHLAQVLAGELVAVPAPAYPVYERGAVFAGKQVLELPLREDGGFLPDLDAVDADTWERVALLWLNYPNNPTAAVAPRALYERAAELAREHGFVVASDEAYSEIYFGSERPISALELDDLTGVAVLNTLSKRSSMPGYRSGFVAGDPELIALLKRYRPNVGVAPQAFVQHAAAAAWRDEEHVERVRAGYRAKRDVLLPVLEARGLRNAGGDATFFLWLDAGPGAELLADRLLDAGIVLVPGSYFGPAGTGYLRLALVPTLAGCERAAERLDALLQR